MSSKQEAESAVCIESLRALPTLSSVSEDMESHRVSRDAPKTVSLVDY